MATSGPNQNNHSEDTDHKLAYILQYQEILTQTKQERDHDYKENTDKELKKESLNEKDETKTNSDLNDDIDPSKSKNLSKQCNSPMAVNKQLQWREVPFGLPQSGDNVCRNHNTDSSEEEDEASKEIRQLLETNSISQNEADLLRRKKNPQVDRRRSLDNDEDEEAAQEIEELLKQGILSSAQAESMLDRRKVMQEFNTQNKNSDALTPFPFDQDGIPVNWSCHDILTESSNSLFTIVELCPGDLEYDQINEELQIAGLEITKLERLENIYLLDRFKGEMQHIKRRRASDFDLNVKYLYHGTKVDKMRICEEGLDQRLSRMGFFGKGIYFSDNPLKCVHYTDTTDSFQESYILKCRVILGDAKIYENGEYDTSLKREPEKEAPSGGWRFYDSVMGCPKDFNEFVVYDNRRAMIEYIISFKLGPDGSQQLRQRQPSPSFSKQKPTEATEVVDVNDEQHFERIRQVREAIRKKRSEERGELYLEPSKEQIQRDKDTWVRLQRLNGVPVAEVTPLESYGNTMKRSHQSYNLSEQAASQVPLFQDLDNSFKSDNSLVDPDPVGQVMDALIQDFLAVTSTEEVEAAKYYIEKAQMDVNQAIVMYYEDLP